MPRGSSHVKYIQNYIGGGGVRGSREFPDVNPADGSVIAQVGEADRDLVDRAVQSAHKALKTDWGEPPCVNAQHGCERSRTRSSRVSIAFLLLKLPILESLFPLPQSWMCHGPQRTSESSLISSVLPLWSRSRRKRRMGNALSTMRSASLSEWSGSLRPGICHYFC